MTVENEGKYNNGGRRWLRWICLHCGHRNYQWDRE
jgi:phage terminase large subunit GpA-like protein